MVCLYLGPSPDYCGYRCLDLLIQRVIISRHVIFDEDHFPFSDFSAKPLAVITIVFSLMIVLPLPLIPFLLQPVLLSLLLLLLTALYSFLL